MYASRSEHLSHRLRKGLRSEPCIVSNANTLARVLLRQDVMPSGRRSKPDIFKGKIVGNNSTPAICAKFNNVCISHIDCLSPEQFCLSDQLFLSIRRQLKERVDLRGKTVRDLDN